MVNWFLMSMPRLFHKERVVFPTNGSETTGYKWIWDPYFTPQTKMISKWIKDNVKTKITKTLRRKHSCRFSWFQFTQWFFKHNFKKSTSNKIDKLDFTSKTSVCLGTLQRKWKTTHIWEKGFTNDIPNKSLKWSESHSVMSNSLWPMDYTVHGILQARILQWVTVPFPRGSSQTRDWTQVSHIEGRFFTSWGTNKSLVSRKCKNTYNWITFFFN